MQTYKEIWKDVPNYEGLYQVSNLGRVKSLNYSRGSKEKMLKPKPNGNGYYYISLYKNRTPKNKYIHRLVTLAFYGESKLTVNHKNGIKSDNRLDNLEYRTQSENNQHAYDTGLKARGESHVQSKLTDAEARKIKYEHHGMTQKDIAKIYGIAQALVSRIRSGKYRKHI